MEFGWLNVSGALIVAAMLIPNILYARKGMHAGNRCANRWMNGMEQIGRYASMLLMVLPLGVWKFGFPHVTALLIYVAVNGGLLAAYWVVWALYFKQPSFGRAMALAIIPTGIFLTCGLTLHHWLLVTAALLFGVGHLYVTAANHR